MRHRLSDQRRSDRVNRGWATGLFAAIAALGLIFTGSWSTAAQAQNAPKPPGAKPPVTRQGTAPLVTTGSGPYYIEFRSRFAWDYGHTYIVHGRVGEAPSKNNVAGLSPVGDDATAWVIGHYVPVPAETGWTDGDLEDKYVTARFRVLVSKDEYDRVVGHIRQLQASSHIWSAELYNCNAFVGDVAQFMGLKVPASTVIMPKIFVNNMRAINTGHPEAADRLISDNLKELSSPTRDGRAMIASGVRVVRPDGSPATDTPAPASTPSPSPSITIGPIHAASKGSN